MTPATLQALRRLLFFSVPEAATHVGYVTERSWRAWEAGQHPVPEDVAERMEALLRWRVSTLTEAEKSLVGGRKVQRSVGDDDREKAGRLTWYASAEAWARTEPRHPERWRPHCSVVAELCARHRVEAEPCG